jgi:hypothetical protein
MFDTDEKYLIIGARKSGSTSLEFYMQSVLGLDVKRHEHLFTRYDGVQYAEQYYPGRIPVVILRNPLHRIESDYSYRPLGGVSNRETDFYQYCKTSKYDQVWGDRNAISQSFYLKWLDLWKNTNLMILNIHTMQKLKGFPHQNQTKEKIKLTKHDIDFAQDMLRMERSSWK